MSDVGSCATPVVPEVGGGGRRHAKKPHPPVVEAPGSIHAQPRPR
jgi:hypothetical protein